MKLVILLPGLLACLALARRTVPQVLLDVYLPTLLLLPMYFDLRLKHLPPLHFSQMAMLPIGVAMIALLAGGRLKWRWSMTDIWIALFVLLIGVSESRQTNTHTGGLEIFSELTGAVLPYMAGRLLIEPYRLRAAFLRRFVVLLSLVAAVGLYEFKTGRSVTQALWKHVFPGEPIIWPQQMRWGFGRIAGPYAQSILCAMIFLMGLLFCMWLRRAYPQWGKRRFFAALPLEIRTVVFAAMIAGLLMTQSRGPWLGALLAIAIVWIGRQQDTRRAAWMVTGAAVLLLAMSWGYANRYTSGSIAQAKTLEQQDAIYRRELLNNYIPIIRERPLLGWGITDYPVMHGQFSIDNEYLLLAVTQGFAGLALFVLINVENWRHMLRAMRWMTGPADRAFLFCLMGIMGGVLATLTTVYLGMQVYSLFFLLTGWIHGLQPDDSSSDVEREHALPYQAQRFGKVLA
jgi:O-antigen ligase